MVCKKHKHWKETLQWVLVITTSFVTPMDHSSTSFLSGDKALQGKTLERAAISFSRASFQPKIPNSTHLLHYRLEGGSVVKNPLPPQGDLWFPVPCRRSFGGEMATPLQYFLAWEIPDKRNLDGLPSWGHKRIRQFQILVSPVRTLHRASYLTSPALVYPFKNENGMCFELFLHNRYNAKETCM